MTTMQRVRIAMVGWAMAMTALAGSSLEGVWAGDRMRLVVDAQGATIEADCADGRVVGPLTLASDGSFVARGTYVEHRSGPQSADVPAVPVPARYSGTVEGDAMTLSVLPDGAKRAQTFSLKRGASIKLLRCL